MQHLVVFTYTGSDDELVKGAMIYKELKLTRAFVHTTFIPDYWGSLHAKFFQGENMNYKGTLLLINKAELHEIDIFEVPDRYHNLARVDL